MVSTFISFNWYSDVFKRSWNNSYCSGLIEKGASFGTVLAFMMSVIGLSLPETIILKKVLKLPMILIFLGVVGLGIIIVGYLFNFIFAKKYEKL